MSKDIIIEMSTKSINDAIKELKALKTDFLRKLDIFTRILANDGVQIALSEIRASESSSNNANVVLTVNNMGDIVSAEISMIGHDALFIEFGAGIYYNPTNPPHVATKEGTFGVGTYPGQTHAFQKGWFYKDQSGVVHYTHGTQATSPLLKASDNYRNNAIKMALAVFRG